SRRRRPAAYGCWPTRSAAATTASTTAVPPSRRTAWRRGWRSVGGWRPSPRRWLRRGRWAGGAARGGGAARRGGDGMALAGRDGRARLLPTRPRQVYDITGAGDMVLSVLGLALAAGADYERAARLANVAGGLEVERVGVATVSREELLDDILKSTV